MSWLSDRIVEYLYKRPDGSEFILEISAKDDPPDLYDGAERKHLLPFKMGGYVRIQFERNGRIGYEYRSEGKKRVVSATREKYEHNIGNMGSKALAESGTKKNESVYTKSYGKEVEKAEHKQAEKLVSGLRKIQGEK